MISAYDANYLDIGIANWVTGNIHSTRHFSCSVMGALVVVGASASLD